MPADYDLIIRNGSIADGSGGALFNGDIAIKGDQIVAIGSVEGRGAEEIDARGMLVTPGFVDIHTHYDGHVTWESRIMPSAAHGVTTIVTGNCGVGFAPCRPDDHDDLIGLMVGVEDIPEVVMADGLEWNWESFPDYLSTVADRPHDVNIAAMVPHSALRVYVMGDRAVRREVATKADIARMAEITRGAMAAGAIGVGTSRAIQQKSRDGEPIPTVGASEDELFGILEPIAEAGGVFQALSDFEQFKDVEKEFGMFRRLGERTGVPISFTLNQKHRDPDGWRRLVKLTEEANDAGVTIRGQVLARPTGILLGHELSRSPFSDCPTYIELVPLPFEDKLAQLKTPEIRARILEEVKEHQARNVGRMFELSETPNYEPDLDDSIAAKAERLGVEPYDYVYDLMLEDGGRRILFDPAQNFADGTLGAAYEMMVHKNTVLGLGDGGAHCGFICDASYPTTVLTFWTRDRQNGPRLDLPLAVRMLTSDTANAVGLRDRGLLKAGYRADINIIDHDRLRLHRPEVIYDLPSAGRRIVQPADGYVATIVSGKVTYREGQATGELPGVVVRGPQAAPTIH